MYLGIGSNMDAAVNLRRAVQSLRERFGEVALSPVYRSAALGFDGDDFLNLVLRLQTNLPVAELLDYLQLLQQRAGRVREKCKYVSRPLDIDLLLYGDMVDATLRLPRRDILEYSFVLLPLAELAADLRHPVTGETLRRHRQAFDCSRHPLTPVALPL